MAEQAKRRPARRGGGRGRPKTVWMSDRRVQLTRKIAESDGLTFGHAMSRGNDLLLDEGLRRGLLTAEELAELAFERDGVS